MVDWEVALHFSYSKTEEKPHLTKCHTIGLMLDFDTWLRRVTRFAFLNPGFSKDGVRCV